MGDDSSEGKPEVAGRREQAGSTAPKPFPPDAPRQISSITTALTVWKTLPLPLTQTGIDTRKNQPGTRHIRDDSETDFSASDDIAEMVQNGFEANAGLNRIRRKLETRMEGSCCLMMSGQRERLGELQLM
jgi:hypothetical protein